MTAHDAIQFAAPGIDEHSEECLLWGATQFPWARMHDRAPLREWWKDVWRAARLWRKGLLFAYIDFSWDPHRHLPTPGTLRRYARRFDEP